MLYVAEERTAGGRLFHGLGPATANARSPIVDRRVAGTTRSVDKWRLGAGPHLCGLLLNFECGTEMAVTTITKLATGIIITVVGPHYQFNIRSEVKVVGSQNAKTYFS